MKYAEARGFWSVYARLIIIAAINLMKLTENIKVQEL
jgi:hypothetical protein